MMGAIGHRKACGERLATAPGEGERMIVGPLHEHTHKECTGRLKGKKTGERTVVQQNHNISFTQLNGFISITALAVNSRGAKHVA